MSALYSHLNQGVRITLLDQAFADFEHGLDYIITDSVDEPELDASFDEPDVVLLNYFRILHLFSTISDNLTCSLFLASNLIIYGARLGCYFTLPFAEKMSVSKLICHFPVIQQYLSSRLLTHQVIEFGILPVRGLVRVFLILMQLLMPL